MTSNVGIALDAPIAPYQVEPLTGKPMNFALIGCGAIGTNFHAANIAARQDMVLHTCCDVSEERLLGCRDRFNPKRLVTDFHEAVNHPEVEAVVIATTANLRRPIIEAAAKAGKAIYCEKPMANSMEEAYAIGEIIRKAGVPFCVGHNRRSSPAMLDAHRIFRAHMENPRPCPWRLDREGANRPRLENDGVAGMLVRVNVDWHAWNWWRLDKGINPYGKMLTEITHFTDLTNWFLAAEPVEVVAMKSEDFNDSAIFRYKTGEMATIAFCNNGTRAYPKEKYEIFGHGAIVVIEHMVETRIVGIEGAPHTLKYALRNDRLPEVGQEGGLSGFLAKRREITKRIAETGDGTTFGWCEAEKGHPQAIARFAHEVRGSGPMVNGIEDSILTMRMAFAAVRSAMERRVVTMDEL